MVIKVFFSKILAVSMCDLSKFSSEIASHPYSELSTTGSLNSRFNKLGY